MSHKHAMGTPITYMLNKATDQTKIDVITQNMTNILNVLGMDLKDDSLKETPKRVAKMYVNELCCGLKEENFPRIMAVENKMGYNQMLLERNVKVNSICEHHLVPFMGVAHIAYIPKEKVIGLSKLNRITDYFCRRPQIQERLTKQIHDKLVEILGTNDVAVVIQAEHLCVKLRGVKDQNSDTITSSLSGAFEINSTTRKEFFDLINLK